MFIFEIALLLAITLITRILFLNSSVFRESLASDFAVHKWLVHSVYGKNGCNLSNRVYENAINAGFVGYPPLPYAWIAKIPFKKLIPVSLAINVVFDFFSVVAIYFFARLISSDFLSLDIATLNTKYFSFGFWLALLYSTTPLLHPINARLLAAGSRTIAPFLALIYFISLFLIQTNQYGLFIPGLAAVVVANLIFLSSHFGLQVLVLFSILLSILWGSWVPIGLFLFASLVGLLYRPIRIYEQFLARIGHTMSYYRLLKVVGIPSRMSLIVLFTRIKNKQLGSVLKFFLVNFSPSILVLGSPLFIWTFYQIAVYCTNQPSDVFFLPPKTIEAFSAGLSIVAVLIFFITSIRPFLIWGEAERYVEYIIPFSLFSSFVYLQKRFGEDLVFVILFIVLFQLFQILFNYIYLNLSQIVRNMSDVPYEKEIMEIAQKVNDSKLASTLTIPLKISYGISRLVDSNTKLYFYVNIFDRKKISLKYHWDDCINNQDIIPDLKHFQKKYGVDSLIVDNRYYEQYYKNKIGNIELEKHKLLLRNHVYSLYQLKKTK